MNTRIATIQLRFVIAVMIIVSLGASLALIQPRQTLPSIPISKSIVATAIALTVSDRPIVTLPTVTVRPAPAEIAAADIVDDVTPAQHSFYNDAATVTHRVLDMPYYSFGKVLPRASKE